MIFGENMTGKTSVVYPSYRNIEGFKFKIEPVASIEDLQQTT